MQLGELEKLVLHYLWENKSADAKQVHAYFEKQRGGSYNTIQSTLDRLFKKDLLSRYKEGHAFQYQAKIKRHELIGQLITSVTSDFITKDETSLVAAFSSISNDLNLSQLDALELMIEKQRLRLEQENN